MYIQERKKAHDPPPPPPLYTHTRTKKDYNTKVGYKP